MIFGKKLVDKVLSGRKTQTRRPLAKAPTSEWIVKRNGQRRRRRPIEGALLIQGTLYRPCRYKSDRTYSVQPARRKKSMGRLLVTDVHRERVGDIDFAAARAEGFRTTAEFKAQWVRIHERDVLANIGTTHDYGYTDEHGTLDVVECVEPSEEALAERFDRAHADTVVWVITFEIAHDEARLLAPAGQEGDGRDYTAQRARALYERRPQASRPPSLGGGSSAREANIPEPEAVDDITIERFATDAAERRAGEPGRRAEDLRKELRSLTVTLRQDAIAADRRGIDVTTVVDRLRQAQQHLEMLDRNQDAA